MPTCANAPLRYMTLSMVSPREKEKLFSHLGYGSRDRQHCPDFTFFLHCQLGNELHWLHYYLSLGIPNQGTLNYPTFDCTFYRIEHYSNYFSKNNSIFWYFMELAFMIPKAKILIFDAENIQCSAFIDENVDYVCVSNVSTL